MHLMAPKGDTVTELPDSLLTAQMCACGNLRRASRAITQRYDTILAPSGLTTPQFGLLARLARTGPITLGNLAQEMGMDRTTLTRDLTPLVREGFVVIGAGEDRRTRVAQLTDAGRAALDRARPLWQEAQTRVITAFGQERFTSLIAELGEMTALAR
jgi:DNA-binding MarR family transcriptional regulator